MTKTEKLLDASEYTDEQKLISLAEYVRETSTIEDPHDGVIAMPQLDGALHDAYRLGYASGKKDGIKEAVDWIQINATLIKEGTFMFSPCITMSYVIDLPGFQSQLRKWGIEQEKVHCSICQARLADQAEEMRRNIANYNAAVEAKRGI